MVPTTAAFWSPAPIGSGFLDVQDQFGTNWFDISAYYPAYAFAPHTGATNSCYSLDGLDVMVLAWLNDTTT